MSMEVKGKLFEVFETQQVKDTFKKREFVIEIAENPTYPEFVKFELIQDKCSMLDSFQKGDVLTVSFNLKGRKWNDPKGGVKYFNTLQAWRLQKDGGTGAPEQGGMDQMEEPGWINENEDTDDLPF